MLVQEAGMTEDGFPVDETGKVTGLENLGIDTLKPQLEAMISGYDGEWSVYVKDLESNEDFVLNDKPLYSASLIKAFVMAKTYQDMDDVLKNEAAQMKTTVDNTKVQDKVNTLLWNMITVSDNESCNELGRLQSDTYDFIDGAKQVNKYLKKRDIRRPVIRAHCIRQHRNSLHLVGIIRQQLQTVENFLNGSTEENV